MAKSKQPKATKPKPKAAKSAARKKPTATKEAAPRKKAPKPKARGARPKAAPRRSESSRFDIAKVIDHPLVADLLTVGAMAAVAAIADHNVKTRTGEAEAGSSKAVKAAGKAAAAAVGKRLLTEVEAIREVAKAKDARRGSR